ncbi:hypothetical protein SDC9_194623 [bioreactor metagenome]|uniref:Uncharacterized protein n=1 Tax=bioreactor metagenome TaxID=1076179 RepID=A0A645II55_9ZZZZ
MLVLDVADVGVRRGFLDVLLRTDLHGIDDAGHFAADQVEQPLE